MGIEKNKNEMPRAYYIVRNKLTITLVVVIALIITALLITGFIFKERNRQIEEMEYRLTDMTERNAAIVHNLFDGYIDTLRAMSVYVKGLDDLTSDETIGFLKNMANSFGLEHLSIGFPDGKTYTTDGDIIVTDGIFFETVQNGQIFITDVTTSQIDGTPVVCIQVPIHKDGVTVASLGYSLKREDLNALLETVLTEKDKYFFIIDGSGEYVAFYSGENPLFSADTNFFDSLNNFKLGRDYTKESVLKAFSDGLAGHMEYSVEGVARYGYYSPVGINDWVMTSIISKNDIDADINRFLKNALTLAAQILFIFLVVAAFVYRDQKKAREITELNEQCFRLLAEHTGKVVLEWDYDKKIMCYPNFENAIGQKPLKDSLGSADEAIHAGAVHPDDCDIYREMFSDIINGRNVENLRLRMRAADEDYKFYSISSVVVFDAKGKPYKSIGFQENIDLQIRKENYLRQKANMDKLTRFYNKAAAEAFISEAVSSSNGDSSHALLCVDLDNFKGINDGLGHLYGDKVLKELAGEIRKLFRTSDILGRFGGDEFVIFVRDIPSTEFVRTKAALLNECLYKTYSNDDAECTISASIGIAVYPTDGDTYETLYKKADEASYIVKNSEKNSYSFAGDEDIGC